MTRQTRRHLLIGAILLTALSAAALATAPPGNFGGAMIGVAVGTVVGAFVMAVEWWVRRVARRDQH